MCALHLGLVSIPFYAIPIYSLVFFCLVLAETTTDPHKACRCTKTCLQFSTTINGSVWLSFFMYVHVCAYHLTKWRVTIVMSVQSHGGILTSYVYPTFNNLHNTLYKTLKGCHLYVHRVAIEEVLSLLTNNYAHSFLCNPYIFSSTIYSSYSSFTCLLSFFAWF